ncbi:hypothetical protein PR048_006809 [Dryococelus australis]|uniref:Uncharacterized protein n=1 Tax=Dryococelus australis TaxID=614101 RepID=A0ABQ9IBZ0_9NEOP|nr:hypothetical protein PR048_006809 [Dryococelus australis]
MYAIYSGQCRAPDKIPVKEKCYYKIFSTKFNLHFKLPNTDTCRLCDEIEMKLSTEKEEHARKALETKKELHLRRAEQARTEIKSDDEKASDEIYCCTFDLQKALPFPKLSTSVSYYERNLYVYDFGIHSFNNSVGYMYLWDETEGRRGSQDISSIILEHLKYYAFSHKNILVAGKKQEKGHRGSSIKLAEHSLVTSGKRPSLHFAVQGNLKWRFAVQGEKFVKAGPWANVALAVICQPIDVVQGQKKDQNGQEE